MFEVRSKSFFGAAASLAVAALVSSSAHALTLSYGRPVTALGSNTSAVATYPSTEGDAYYNPANGQIKYYIPVNGSACPTTSGFGCIFGVTDVQPGSGVTTAGTTSDTGSGGQMTMFLRFEAVELPAALATLTLSFGDLDLVGAADTGNFFESVRFYNDNGNAITNTIDNLNDDNNGSVPFTVTGNSSDQTIFFSDLTSIVEAPFFIALRFRSDYTNWGWVSNTPEYMTATLKTAAVPEPASMFLLGSGLFGVAAARRRKVA